MPICEPPCRADIPLSGVGLGLGPAGGRGWALHDGPCPCRRGSRARRLRCVGARQVRQVDGEPGGVQQAGGLSCSRRGHRAGETRGRDTREAVVPARVADAWGGPKTWPESDGSRRCEDHPDARGRTAAVYERLSSARMGGKTACTCSPCPSRGGFQSLHAAEPDRLEHELRSELVCRLRYGGHGDRCRTCGEHWAVISTRASSRKTAY